MPRRDDDDPQIIHYDETIGEPVVAERDEALFDAVRAHVAKYYGAEPRFWSDAEPDTVHIDVLVVDPTEDRDFTTLVTAGMSSRPMRSPEGETIWRELVIAVPTELDAAPTEPEGWPSNLLQYFARMPHVLGSWLDHWHTVPNGDPATPWASSTTLTGALFAPPMITPEDFDTFEHDGHQVEFLAVVLLHSDEMELKLREGTEALADLLDAAEIVEGLVPDRPSAVKRKGLFRR